MKNQHEELERTELISILTEWLPVLRATIGISQAEIANRIGISRQTYCAFELRKRIMSWSTFLTLFLFFISNEKTYDLMKTRKGYIAQVYKAMKYVPEWNSV